MKDISIMQKIKSAMHGNSGLFMKELKINQLRENHVSLIIGKRGCGKTSLVCQMIKKDPFFNHQNTNLYILTNQPEDTLYCTVAINTFILSNQNILASEKILENVILNHLEECNHGSEKKLAIFYDDYISFASNFENNNVIKESVLGGHHYNITTYISTQWPFEISPLFKTCIDYVFMFPDHLESAQQLIHKKYGDFIPFNLFQNACKTLNNDIVVIHCEKIWWMKKTFGDTDNDCTDTGANSDDNASDVKNTNLIELIVVFNETMPNFPNVGCIDI